MRLKIRDSLNSLGIDDFDPNDIEAIVNYDFESDEVRRKVENLSFDYQVKRGLICLATSEALIDITRSCEDVYNIIKGRTVVDNLRDRDSYKDTMYIMKRSDKVDGCKVPLEYFLGETEPEPRVFELKLLKPDGVTLDRLRANRDNFDGNIYLVSNPSKVIEHEDILMAGIKSHGEYLHESFTGSQEETFGSRIVSSMRLISRLSKEGGNS